MKISITNVVALNGGDAAILLGMIKIFKEEYGEDVDIVVFDKNPEACRKLYPEIKWELTLGLLVDRTPFNRIRYLGRIARKLKRMYFFGVSKLMGQCSSCFRFLISGYSRRLIDRYASSDIIISTGGTYLIENYGILSQYIDYRISLNLNKRLIFYTQSMGPFFKSATVKRLTDIFNRTELMLFRDKRSFDNVKALNLKHWPKMYETADAAFSLGNTDIINRRNDSYFGEFKRVAFSVRAWSFFSGNSEAEVMNNYIDGVSRAVIYLIDSGNEVAFFSTCQGITEYDDDSKLAATIIEKLPLQYRNKVVNYVKHLSINEILELLSNMDAIISTRLHMSILSLISGTPVLPIAYEFKISELFGSLGYKDVLTMKEVTEDAIVEKYKEFEMSYDSVRRKAVNQSVIGLIEQSKESAKLINN